MNVQMFKKVLSISFLIASFVMLFSATLTYAAPSENSSVRSSDAMQAKSTDSGRVRSCMARMEAVQTRSQNMLTHSETFTNRIHAIAAKVDEFYQNRVLAAGKSVENYEDLQAQLQAKQRVVEMKMNEAQNQAGAFNCASDDPKAQVREFGASMQEVVRAMKEYKTAARNLLVAVHRVSLGLGEQN